MILFRLLKNLSAEQLVIGRMHRLLVNVLIFGYIEVACLRAGAGLDGVLVGVVYYLVCNVLGNFDTTPSTIDKYIVASLTLSS